MTNAVRAIVCSGQINRFGEFRMDQPNAGRDIGRALYLLNLDAVMWRYPDCRDDPANLPGWDGCHLMPETFDFTHYLRPMLLDDLVMCVKALQCVRYQCNEGDIDKTPLYVALDEACTLLMQHVVTQLPAYQRAPWGD
jgi:hypothetical protein